MVRHLARSLTVALLVGLVPDPIPAQEPVPGSAGEAAVSRRDSARLLRAARSEQALFERIRRNHLPWAWGGGSGTCDERIGRFCLTHGDREDDWEPPPEAEQVAAARERLVLHLNEAARALPGDGWLVGQRVRYLMEGRRIAEARTAATQCQAARWWCRALLGFVNHYAGEAAAADSAFSSALAAMPDEVRREWTDLSYLLDPPSYRAYRRLDPAERERFAERFWSLGDPFFMRPGNELRSEHLSRNVWDAFQERARSTENISWGDDLRQILLRYGWPAGWERIRERPGSLSPPSLVSHYANSDRNLAPPHQVLVSDSLDEGEWDVETNRPRTGYALPLTDSLARWLSPLDHQIAVFRRGDSALVVASYEVPADSFPQSARIEAGLAVASRAADPPHVTRFPAGGTRDVLSVATSPGRLLLSLEVLSEQARRAARARTGVHIPALPEGLLAVSDLLLLRSADELPDSLRAALSNIRGSTRVQPGERIGVYWEVYGLPPEQAQSLTMSLRLLNQEAGWLQRLAERMGLLAGSDAIRLRWQELATATPFVTRSLAVQIPDVRPGRYALELSLTLPGREALTITRALEVR